MALLEGLKLYLSLGLRNVVVEMDSLTLLNSVKGLQRCPWRVDGEVLRICSLLSKVDFNLLHCYREINFAADSLAKLALQTLASTV